MAYLKPDHFGFKSTQLAKLLIPLITNVAIWTFSLMMSLLTCILGRTPAERVVEVEVGGFNGMVKIAGLHCRSPLFGAGWTNSLLTSMVIDNSLVTMKCFCYQ